MTWSSNGNFMLTGSRNGIVKYWAKLNSVSAFDLKYVGKVLMQRAYQWGLVGSKSTLIILFPLSSSFPHSELMTVKSLLYHLLLLMPNLFPVQMIRLSNFGTLQDMKKKHRYKGTHGKCSTIQMVTLL